MSRPLAAVVLLLAGLPVAAAELTVGEADVRLRRAYALARETNDSALVSRLLDLRDGVKKALDRKDPVAAESLVRDAETGVGLDPGGKTMFGLPVAHVDPRTMEPAQGRVAAAMKAGDPAAVAAAVKDLERILGDQVGVPDVRRKGETGKPVPIKPADVADVFLKAVQADPRAVKALSAGVPGPDTMPRAYASVVQGCLTARPFVERYQRDKLPVLDGLIGGCCKAMLALQMDAGHFKFPDLRGKNLRFGDMIEKLVEKDPDAVRNGWVVVPDPEGGSQFDAGECGLALLRAGAAFKNAEWTKAGLRAADWALTTTPVPNFNYNAFSVSLLSEAFRVTGDRKYRDGALAKYRVGVAPGQTANGRWADPHNARTVYHVILLRALHDLLEVLPAGPDRDSVASAARLAVKALTDEAEKLGAPMTSHTVQELERHTRLVKDTPPAVRSVLEQAASGAVQRCLQGGKVRAAVPLPELAAVGRVWAE